MTIMARKKKSSGIQLSSKNLAYMIFAGLIIQFVLPAINLGSLSWISTVLYLIVGLYLLLR